VNHLFNFDTKKDFDVASIVSKFNFNLNKLIYISDFPLVWSEWERLNNIDITVANYKEIVKKVMLYWDNHKFKQFFKNIYDPILNDQINRVHVITLDSHTSLEDELLTIEWSWTLIGKWFTNPEVEKADFHEIDIIEWILDSNVNKWHLKPRDHDYILFNHKNFYLARVDNIPVGCMELIEIDVNTIELWWLSIVSSYMDYKIWTSLIQFWIEAAKNSWKTLISVTDNPKLEAIYANRFWFIEDTNWKYISRIEKSPGKKLFYIPCNS